MKDNEDCVVDIPSNEEELRETCSVVIRAGIWLIRNGYGGMMLLPYVAPSGCYWRCEFHLKGKSQKVLYRYSSSSGRKYLQDHCGGSIRKEVSPASLAKAIMKSVPEEFKVQCKGDVSPEVVRWLDQLDSALSNGYLPQAFHEYSTDYSLWELVDTTGKLDPSHIHPQPGYIPPGAVPHWSQELFWRDALNNWEALRKVNEITFSPSDVDSAAATSSIASELYRAMKDNDEDDAERLFKAAIAALHDSVRYSPD